MSGNFIHVRVGNSSGRACTPMSAVVPAVAEGLSMVRRVGSLEMEVRNWHMETLHFELIRSDIC